MTGNPLLDAIAYVLGAVAIAVLEKLRRKERRRYYDSLRPAQRDTPRSLPAVRMPSNHDEEWARRKAHELPVDEDAVTGPHHTRRRDREREG